MDRMNYKAYLLLGSNMGQKETNLRMAHSLIENSVGAILQSSKVYESAAWGKEDQPNFLNQVIKIHTSFNPYALLGKLSWIETSLGRLRAVKWGERIIDIDILFYDDEIIQENILTIPHPGIPKRRFTLIPLNEIAPTLIHPQLGKPISQLLEMCEDKLKVWEHLTNS
ncbi:MAG TPA: 2-amino-4-hydroxy-6-hydroxymethyldihydropteridine diphosphokinase [Cyclobacteriaceae bacterium]